MSDVSDRSDEGVIEIPPIEIDLENPLLPMLAIQFDFRERFAHALEQAIALDVSFDSKTATLKQLREHHRLVMAILFEALDVASIDAWVQANRPMPWIDNTLRDEIRVVTERAREVIALMNSIETP